MSRLENGPEDKQRIDSWKEIASFFGRDERTVKRWEQSRSLPVHRVPGTGKSSVFAYAYELREWLHSAQQEKASPGPSVPPAQPEPPLSKDETESSPEEVVPGPKETADAPAPRQEKNAPLQLPHPARPGNSRGSVIEMPRSNAGYVDPASMEKNQPHLAPRSGRKRPTGTGRSTPYGGWLPWIASALIAFVLLSLIARRWSRQSPPGADPGDAPQRSSPASDTDAQAEDFYLKGRYYWNRRTAESLNQAVDAFTQAIVHDPADAEAYAGLADCYDLMSEYTPMRPSEAYPRAIAAATKAVALDDSLSEAHRALAFGLFFGNWETSRGLAEYRRAIQLDPNDVEAHHWYATSLMSLGRYKEALAELERARELDPASKSIVADRDLLIYQIGDRDNAIADLMEQEQAEPDFLSPAHYLAAFYLERGDYRAYLGQTRKIAAISKGPQDLELADAAERGYSRGGKRGMLEEMRRVQQKAFESGQASGYDVAYSSLLLGENAAAIPYLRTAVAIRDSRLIALQRSAFAQPLKNDPHFQEILARVQAQVEADANSKDQSGGSASNPPSPR